MISNQMPNLKGDNFVKVEILKKYMQTETDHL